MSTANDNPKSDKIFDKIKWIIIFALIVSVVWGNFYFSEPNSIYEPNTMVRIAAIILISILAAVLSLTTGKGKTFINFAKESRMELRKIVWPTKQETIKTTLLIAAITLVVGLCLWGLDSFFLWAISKLTVLGH